jgi:DNA gyrase subunit A
MRLQKLTGLEIDKLEDEYKNTLKDIEFYKNILNNRDVLNNVIYDELTEIKDKYGDERLTEISSSIEEINVEDLIPDDEAVVTITHNGYIKRTPLTSFTAQKRGGKGKSGALSKGDDFIERIIVSSNHSKLMFFTNFGNIYFLKVYELPESAPGTRGRHISNFIEFSDNEYIASVLSVSDNVDDKNIIFGTKKGLVKKSHVNLFKSGRSGIKAIKLRDGDEIVSTDFVTDDDNILLATKNGKAIHFSASEIRSMGRNASGVKGIDLAKSDEVVSMEIASGAPFLLTVTENGFGKRTMVNEYRLQSRGGKGVKLSKVTPKTGNICGAKQVLDSDDVMLITKSGKIIRTGVSQISVLSRDTQGVTLMNTGDDYIVSFAVIKEV